MKSINALSPFCGGGELDYSAASSITLTKGSTIEYTPTSNGLIVYRGLFGEYILCDKASQVSLNGGDPNRWSSASLPVTKGRVIQIYTSCDTYNCWFVPNKN